MRTRVSEGTESGSSTSASWMGSFRGIQAYLDDLAYDSTSGYLIAGVSIRLHFGSEAFRERVAPAFCHLECSGSSETSFSVFLHDVSSAPHAAVFLEPLDSVRGDADIWLAESPDLTLILQGSGQVVSAVDWRRNVGYWLVSDASSIPYLEQAAPLRLLLTHWLGRQGRYLVHAAAVGNASGGVLILGHGGAGKSTTAMSCLDGGLGYAGDDFCLVSNQHSPYVHSIYGSGKLAAAGLDRFPHLAPAAAPGAPPQGEKTVLHFGLHPAIAVSQGFPLRAILLARIAALPNTRLRPTGRADAFKAIAPSCALHLPAARPSALGCFNELVRQLPACILELGSNFESTPAAIRQLLDGSLDPKGANNERQSP